MQNMIAMLSTFREKYLIWMNLPYINEIDIVEILIIAFLFYHVLVWIQNTHAWMLFKGIIVILIFVLFAALFQMNTILWIVERTLNIMVIAIVVVFQPELRRALEQLGRRNFFASFFSFEFGKNTDEKFSDKTIAELVKACFEMGKVKTGALIVVEDAVALSDYERTGIKVDAIVSCQLLINIFEKNTPLHDGAIIVRGDRVVSATCYLPLSDNMDLSKDLGTRHRAAVGISEVSDSLTIVVSEETGKVSVALGGKIIRDIDADILKIKLQQIQKYEPEVSRLELLKRRLKNGKKVNRSAD